MDSWLRIAVFAIILLSFLRRIMKLKSQGRPPSPAPQMKVPTTFAPTTFAPTTITPTAITPTTITPTTITPTIGRPGSGKKNDFRDVPPPPENPELG